MSELLCDLHTPFLLLTHRSQSSAPMNFQLGFRMLEKKMSSLRAEIISKRLPFLCVLEPGYMRQKKSKSQVQIERSFNTWDERLPMYQKPTR